MALSTLSPNVWVMMVIYGVVGGIFFGMVYLPYVEHRYSLSIHWQLCVVCIDPWWWFRSISRRNERLLMVGESSSLFRLRRPSSDRDCHRWYGYWRAVIRTVGWLSDEELRLEIWHVRLCWSDAFMHSIRSHYETTGTEEGSHQTSCRKYTVSNERQWLRRLFLMTFTRGFQLRRNLLSWSLPPIRKELLR